MIPVLGLGGEARSGKNFVASLVRDEFGFIPWAFANPIKFAVYSQRECPWSLNTLFYEEKPKELRERLQLFGTEMGRDIYGQQVWNKQTEAFIFLAENEMKAKGVVLSDIRFPDEADFVKSLGGIVLKVNREGSGLSDGLEKHRTESLISQIKFDGIIDNTQDVDQQYLLDQLRPYIQQLGVD
jgi:hypothetical protein